MLAGWPRDKLARVAAVQLAAPSALPSSVATFDQPGDLAVMTICEVAAQDDLTDR
jgi:hypothetical protein